jgi:hypothetical protein
MDFITIAQVDSLLGVEWTTEDKKPRAVLMSNTWLNERVRQEFSEVPSAIVQAGAEIAREAALGTLYGAKDREVISETKTVDAVSKSATYSQGSSAISAGEAFALALLKPFMGGSQIKMVRG